MELLSPLPEVCGIVRRNGRTPEGALDRSHGGWVKARSSGIKSRVALVVQIDTDAAGGVVADAGAHARVIFGDGLIAHVDHCGGIVELAGVQIGEGALVASWGESCNGSCSEDGVGSECHVSILGKGVDRSLLVVGRMQR